MAGDIANVFKDKAHQLQKVIVFKNKAIDMNAFLYMCAGYYKKNSEFQEECENLFVWQRTRNYFII